MEFACYTCGRDSTAGVPQAVYSLEKMKAILDDLARVWGGSRVTGRERLAARCGRGFGVLEHGSGLHFM